MDGFIGIDKAAGMTSHDVVAAVRRIARQKKVGHTGTLDPFATGVLPVALGEATKAIGFLDESVKEYRAVMRLGIATDTQDYTGKVVQERDWHPVTPPLVREVVGSFVGRSSQVPPMFSALKQGGVPLYKIARQGGEVERAARHIEIFAITVDDIELPLVTFTVRCSRGTYVRTLANDIGERLGCGAHLVELRRNLSGPFTIQAAITLDQLAVLADTGRLASSLLSLSDALPQLRCLSLTAAVAQRVACGIAPKLPELQMQPAEALRDGEKVRLCLSDRLVAVAECSGAADGTEDALLRLLRVFN